MENHHWGRAFLSPVTAPLTNEWLTETLGVAYLDR